MQEKVKRRRKVKGQFQLEDVKVNDAEFLSQNSEVLEAIQSEVRKFTENCQSECAKHGVKVKVTILFEF